MKKPLTIALFVVCAALGGCSSRPAAETVAVVSATPLPAPTATPSSAAGTDQSARPKDEAADSDAGPAEFNGTAGVTEKEYKRDGAAMLVGVRTAGHPGFDRVVFEFSGLLPSYHVEYIDKPVRQCGSGNTVAMAGDAWLQIRFSPANAHTENGEATVPTSKVRPGHNIVKELASTCDFEAEVVWVAGVAKPNKYRVIELKNPTRLAVDVQH